MSKSKAQIELEIAQGQVKALEEQRATLAYQVQTLTAQRDQQETRLTNLRTQNDTLRGQIRNARENNSILRGACEMANAALKDADERIRILAAPQTVSTEGVKVVTVTNLHTNQRTATVTTALPATNPANEVACRTAIQQLQDALSQRAVSDFAKMFEADVARALNGMGG